jgi:phospholipid/cholesterol/gamma-HCH transport system permease protein
VSDPYANVAQQVQLHGAVSQFADSLRQVSLNPAHMRTSLDTAFSQVGNIFALSNDLLRKTFKRPFQFREFIEQSWFVASVSILPSALVAIPFGAVVALQTGSLIKQLGAESFTGATSVLATVQQAAPVVTALIIAGAAGSAVAADLGSRTIREEIDAMEVLGIDPVQRLVVPRDLAIKL